MVLLSCHSQAAWVHPEVRQPALPAISSSTRQIQGLRRSVLGSGLRQEYARCWLELRPWEIGWVMG